MFRFAVLGSGSKGNAVLVEAGSTRLLLDCGLTAKQTRDRLKSLDVGLSDLTALCITHGHADHIRSANKLAGAMRQLTYCTEKTARMMARAGGIQNHAPLDEDGQIQVGDVWVTTFPTPHDAPGSVGFLVDDGHHRLGYCTDLGVVNRRLADALSTCDSLVLEFNHDVQMLQDGPYPPRLKRRVLSKYGHISNVDAGRLLRAAARPGLRKVLLAHLSEVNNTPALALDAAHRAVEGRDVEVAVAPQHHPTGWLRVAPPGHARRTFSRTPKTEAITRALREQRRRKSEHRALAVSRQLSLFGGEP